MAKEENPGLIMGEIDKLKSFKAPTSAETDVFKCLFFHGPTWDGNIPSKMGRDSLCKRGLVHHEFGFAWLTREGVEFAIKVLELDRAKERWERSKRSPYLDFEQ